MHFYWFLYPNEWCKMHNWKKKKTVIKRKLWYIYCIQEQSGNRKFKTILTLICLFENDIYHVWCSWVCSAIFFLVIFCWTEFFLCVCFHRTEQIPNICYIIFCLYSDKTDVVIGDIRYTSIWNGIHRETQDPQKVNYCLWSLTFALFSEY